MRVSPQFCTMVGTKILHYQLIDKIGVGGMGEIYKAQDTRLNRLVAVKILSPGMSHDPERRRRFFQEAQAASALNHPNIITLYDIVSEGDLQCIVMEYIDGKTLRDLIPARGLPPLQVLQYAMQIASALAAAHSAGLIHRDLKPSNIMVNSSGLIKVLDFGLAKWVDPGMTGQSEATLEAGLTREGSIIGTVSYMSPEQAEGKRVDARSDIFSFGSVLYEMLTGRRAFEGRSGISTLSSILRDDVPPIYEAAPDVPPSLEQIVLRCLPKEPSARWQSMKEIEAALVSVQRQLDPEGHFASPIPMGPMSGFSPPPSVQTPWPTPSALSPGVGTSVSDSDPLAGATPPLVYTRANGPAAGVNSTATTSPKTPPINTPAARPPAGPRNGDGARKAPARPPTARKPGEQSPRLMVLLLALIGVILVAGAASTGWYWWKTREAATVAKVTPSAPTLTPSAPIPAPPPVQTPEVPPTAAETTPPANPEPEKPKRTPKHKAEKTPKTFPTPAPAVTPATAPPTPAAAPLPPPPKLAPTKPVIQTTPIMVSDALPFVLRLDQDVPSNAPEGQPIRFTVGEDLKVDGKTVLAKGSTVTGEVMGETGKKFLGIGGHKLTFRLSRAEAVDGRKLSVRALAGKSGAAIRSFETTKGSKSKGYAALQGAEYIGYIDGDQMVAVRK